MRMLFYQLINFINQLMYRTKYKPLINSQQINPTSKSQIQNNLTKSKEYIPHFQGQQPSQQHNSQDQITSSNSQKDNRQSQFSFLRRQSPIKIQCSLIQSCARSKLYSTCLSEVEHPKNFMKIQGSNKEEQIFNCKHSVNQSGEFCQICKGKGFLKQSDKIVKFFKYIINFKIGKEPYYSTNKQEIQQNQAKIVCTDFQKQPSKLIPKKYKNKNFTYRINERKSQCPVLNERQSNVNIKRVNQNTNNLFSRFSTKSATYHRRQEVIEELNNVIAVHENYQCDQCMCDPIVGSRFHCNTCGDFDLCQQCNKKFPHMHLMQQIQKSGKNKQIESMLNFLASPIKMNISVRPPKIQSQEYLAVSRSAIA